MNGWLVNDELERIWKEGLVPNFKEIYRRSPEVKPRKTQNSRFPGHYLNPGPPEYEARVLTTQLRLKMRNHTSA
jgi:hypothetical protein